MAGLMEGRTWFFTQAITLFKCILLYENTSRTYSDNGLQ